MLRFAGNYIVSNLYDNLQMTTENENITRLLLEHRADNRAALDELFPLVYDELRRLAGSRLRAERANHTLQATALVHEAYLRLINQHSVNWLNRAQFFGLAAEMMRRILVNHAEKRHAEKRGSGQTAVSIEDAAFASDADGKAAVFDVLFLNEALNRLAEFDPRQARIVELKFFGGLNGEEIAEVLSVSVSTVKREWRIAKAWLGTQL